MKAKVKHPVSVAFNARAIEHEINEIFFEDSMCPAFTETSLLAGQYKGYQIQLIVTRDESNFMDDDCDKGLISIKKTKFTTVAA